MPQIHTDDEDPHESAYAGLLVNDAHWAFGTGQEFHYSEDPLVGATKSPVPEGVDARELAAYCLALGDDALVLSQRLSEWCSRAPDLEEDIALANIALDLLGQARLLLARAAAADPTVVPDLGDSPVPDEDRLAFFRDAGDFRCCRFVELPNGDFAQTMARVLLFAAHRLALFQRLAGHPDPVLAAITAKGVKELAYHRDFAARWCVTLARGTEESRSRLVDGLATLWRHRHELGEEPDAALAISQVLDAAGLQRPDVPPATGTGQHTEALSLLLAEMQVVARAHPRGRW